MQRTQAIPRPRKMKKTFKLVISAGHYLGNPKRCLKSLDPNETREWVLNDRVADKLEKILADYDGIEILRVDDTTGKKNVTLEERTDAANEWEGDFYVSIHFNAGVSKIVRNEVGIDEDGEPVVEDVVVAGKGGGIVVYVYTNPQAASVEWQKALYDSMLRHGGLKGNRATPLARADLHEVRETRMPACLCELGFMDSSTDVPVILTEEYADNMAKALAEVVIEKSGAKKKARTLYRVQVGAFGKKENAEAMLKKLEAAGFEGYITRL